MRLLSLLVLLACLAAGCGSVTGEDRPGTEATLLLDFTPNAVHSGIYMAADRGFDTAEGVTLTVRKPGASTDALKLLGSGRADLAILDIHDLGLARQEGADVVGVMAVVQRPLAAVLAQPGIGSPAELEGKRAGVTGLPSDDAVLRSVVEGAGGDPDAVDATTIGFRAVPAMIAGRVDAATAFWNVEGVALKAEKPGVEEFRVDDFGAPAYPELVLAVTRETLDAEAPMVRAAIRALQRGYGEAQTDPESAVATMVAEEPELDAEALSAQFDAVAPAFTAGAGAYGQLRRPVLERWADWDVEFGILDERPDVGAAFDTSLVGPTDRG